MTTASYPLEGYDLAIALEGEQAFAWVRFDDRSVAERVARAMAAGEEPRVQVELPRDADTSAHAISDVLTADLRLLDGDDVIGHAISVRLPNAEAAREFQMKMVAAGALVGTLVVASVGAQALPSIHFGTSTGSADAAAGLAQQRAGEISAGASLADPAAGIAEYRAGEIGAGSSGVADYRAGEIGAGAGAAIGTDPAAGIADYRAGEIGAGSSGVADYRAGEINAGSDDQDDTGPQRPADSFRGR